jgi:hypothetical protein
VRVLGWIAVVLVVVAIGCAFLDAGTAPTSSTDFCDTHVCIPNSDEGRGTTVQSGDGTWSQSGGVQGACSHHGGAR